MNLVSRYAPSPSGPLHLGNLRTALFAWLQARWSHSIFILRIDDLDGPRTVHRMAEQAIEDLTWLGLDWDQGPVNNSSNNLGDLSIKGSCGPYFQSKCDDHYTKAFNKLKESGYLYKCVCSRKEWQSVAIAPHGKTKLYPGTCRVPGSEHRQRLESGAQYSWRFRADAYSAEFFDEILGTTGRGSEDFVDDFIVRRGDGQFAYHLATVVDDARMKVTDVLRGADLVESTSCQIALIEALNYQTPKYWHVPLMLDSKGKRLAKRDGSNSVTLMRKQGFSRAEILKLMFDGLTEAEDIIFESPQTVLESSSLGGLITSLRGNSPIA
jgi:glutamyl-tRNA synthetase